MNLFAEMRVLVTVALDKMITEGQLPQGLSFENVAVEPPRDALHGDMATNAAMVLAKPSRQKPRDIADKLAAHLMQDPRITTADVAGPGFLNLRLAPTVWQGLVKNILEQGTAFGRSLDRGRQAGERGICQCEPHRTATRWPYQRRCVRRRLGGFAGLCRI